jgi:hypothetical protein
MPSEFEFDFGSDDERSKMEHGGTVLVLNIGVVGELLVVQYVVGQM